MARGTASVVWRALLWVLAGGALLGTGLLTVPRLTDPGSARGLELVAFTPFGLAPAVALLVIAIALAVAHRGGPRLLGAVLASVGLVATALHLMWLAPLFVGAQPAARGEPLVVMTQNFEYGDVLALAREVRDRQVDVLVLCDMGTKQWTGVQESSIPNDLPYVADREGGAVAFSRYPLAEDEPITLHGGGSRSVHITTSPLGHVTLYALHPAQPYRPGEWQEDGARVVGAVGAGLSGDPDPTIVAGDLNATLDHWPLRALASIGFTDAVVAVNGGFQPTFPVGGREQRFGITVPPVFQIDHVFVSRQLVVSEVARVATPGADHLGVLATIRRAAS
ncbi:MAG: endonuclease/exonuclease/phosphatase family protein [Intrasporangium sp.]|uniref:endonuclease/exonuclease/phosphatase family protein n=1 Tax=Intrasporangium sp. TaxID=1925024 RepID=UPI0026474756|nr:endonuclease/exonuclease/phosphatase family protein [Intrasporangium sp.]MDN5795502.1 endonuclease/exonuclease/phosphatase family protein [Intrasporangium sp.]